MAPTLLRRAVQVIIVRGKIVMNRRRVRLVLLKTQLLQNAHAAREKRLPFVRKDGDAVGNLLEIAAVSYEQKIWPIFLKFGE